MKTVTSSRVVAICAIMSLAAACVAVILSVLSSTGRLGLPPDTLWVQYFATYRRVLGVPFEFTLAVFSLALLATRNAVSAVPISAAMLGLSVGFLPAFRSDIILWVVGVSALCALFAAAAQAPRSLAECAVSVTRDVHVVRQAGHARSRLTIAVLLALMIGLVIRQELELDASEAARHERLIQWYSTALSRREAGPLGISFDIYTDYQCPSCRVMVPQFEAAAVAAGLKPSEIQLKDFPLDSTCNTSVPSGAVAPHAVACSAAIAGRLVAREAPDSIATFRSWLYSQQEILTDAAIEQKLIDEGLGESYRNSRQALQLEVMQDIQDAVGVGVFSTPALVLNGVRLPSLTPRGVEVLLRYEVARQE